MDNYARLARALGAARLKELMFTARAIGAEEAIATGFTEVIEDVEARVRSGKPRLVRADDALGDQGGAAPRARPRPTART